MLSVRGPVFLVGCPRSGTTLLQRLLDGHQDVAIAPETHYVRRVWKRRRTLGDVRTEAGLRAAQQAFVEMPEFGEMGVDRERFLSRTAACETLPDLFAALLDEFAARRGKALVGEKTPNHLLYMRLLERQFPDARFVHIVRDPRAVAHSWSRVPWSNGSLEADAEVWRKYMRAARRRPPRDRSRLLEIRYEELVRDPERVLSDVCRFLRIEYDPGMLELRDAGTINYEREPWKRSDPKTVSADAADRWRRTMRVADIAVVEAVVFSEMRARGYRPVCGGPRVRAAATLHAAKRALRDWTKRSRRRLRRSGDPR